MFSLCSHFYYNVYCNWWHKYCKIKNLESWVLCNATGIILRNAEQNFVSVLDNEITELVRTKKLALRLHRQLHIGCSTAANSEDHFRWRHDASSTTAFVRSFTYSSLRERKPTSFPWSLILPPPGALWGGKMSDPGNEVGVKACCFWTA